MNIPDFKLELNHIAASMSQTVTKGAPPKDAVVPGTIFAEAFWKKNEDLGILPPVVRSFTPDAKCWFLERPPFMAEIQYGTTKYVLPVPWTSYVVTLAQNPTMVIMCRPEQIYDETDALYNLPLSNIDSGGGVCVGNSLGVEIPGGWTNMKPPEKVAAIVNAFWTSKFNNDLSSHGLRIMPSSWKKSDTLRTIRDVYAHWAKLDLFESLKTDWTPNPIYPNVKNVLSLMDRTFQNANTNPAMQLYNLFTSATQG